LIPEHLSSDRFAAALAARLDAVVPDNISVRAEGSGVSVYDPDPWGTSLILPFPREDGRPTVELVESVARVILSSTQDVVMRSTREQWPVGPDGVGEPGPGHRERVAPVVW
jgi:hypothetical protein